MLLRSQDKLKQTDTGATSLMVKPCKEGAAIVAMLGESKYLIMGRYADEKTAVDVLDMIEEFERCNMTIFDMPQNV